MAIFGLGNKVKASKKKKTVKKGSSDAQAVLKKMKAKKASGDCAFC